MIGPAVTRDEAAEEARRELSRTIYHQAEPSWPERVVSWLSEQLTDLWTSATQPSGGGLGIAAVVIVAAVAAVAVWLRLGPVRRQARTAPVDLDLSSPLSAAALRAEADAAARAGAFAEAVRSRLRAVVRMLEETGVLEPRPGCTAGELVTEVGRIAPATTPALASAVAIFSEIWYGGLEASEASYRAVVQADEALTGLRPRAGTGGRPAPTFTVPA
ncbi:DUF4129 domain-containing protein [Candidatus Protofrankia californiensis]|uniref:DUF4129 domain-containing protein n=1 Tax=Candidatus Protofrankia californiensis TaxID=1839754 RepID=UPI001040E305|nr:DUF4129 domain-containing protein [Candidatus Protofrankia californiensis]